MVSGNRGLPRRPLCVACYIPRHIPPRSDLRCPYYVIKPLDLKCPSPQGRDPAEQSWSLERCLHRCWKERWLGKTGWGAGRPGRPIRCDSQQAAPADWRGTARGRQQAGWRGHAAVCWLSASWRFALVACFDCFARRERSAQRGLLLLLRAPGGSSAAPLWHPPCRRGRRP